MNIELSNGLSRREAVQIFGAGLLTAGLAPSSLQAASPFNSGWSEASHSAIRLIRGNAAKAGEYSAGIVVRMKPGFKTYWRHPGDSGVPPVFRFETSQNLRSVTVHFPAPKRFDDGAGGVSFGYMGDEVIFPLTVVAQDPKAAVVLRLVADYAVCEKLCVPAHGTGVLALFEGPPSPFVDVLRKAISLVPAMTQLGAIAPLQMIDLRKAPAPEHFLVGIRVPEGSRPELFVEGETPWFLETKAFMPGIGGAPGTFEVLVVERDRSPDCAGANLLMTLVAGDRAIEVRTRLDMALITP